MKNLQIQKRAFLMYLTYLLNKQKEGIINDHGIVIVDEIEAVNDYIDTIDIMLQRHEVNAEG